MTHGIPLAVSVLTAALRLAVNCPAESWRARGRARANGMLARGTEASYS